MATVNPAPRPKPIDRRRVLKFAHDLGASIELAFNKFLGKQLRPIMEAQQAINGSIGYRIRDQAFFLNMAECPMVYDIGALPHHIGRPDALDSSLMVPHAAWMELYEEHLRSWDKVRAGIGSMVAKAASEQDWRDMFPEHVIRGSLDHPFLQRRIDTKDDQGRVLETRYETLSRSKPDVYASGPDSKNWSPLMYPIYARISDHVDTYIGMKFVS